MNGPFYAQQAGQMAWQQWLHSLAHRHEQLEKHQAELESRYLKLEEQLRRLEEANQKLKEQVDGLKPAQYGNITYKVQELHVNELTGTLNIGLTSLADEGQMKAMMEQMKLDGQDLQIPGGSPVADSSG